MTAMTSASFLLGLLIYVILCRVAMRGLSGAAHRDRKFDIRIVAAAACFSIPGPSLATTATDRLREHAIR